MRIVTPVRALAAAVLMGGLLVSTAVAAAPATIHFSGGSVAFLGSINWGGGTLRYEGRSIPIKVSGIGVGAIGADKFSADGTVTGLHHISDIEGTYTALNASATAGGGEGAITMRNSKGVQIDAHSTSAGLKLSLAPTGMTIKLK
jgi:hypothetical protein